MAELEGKEEVLVVGLGRSGRAAVEKLLSLGKRVTANDISSSEAVRESAEELSLRGAEVVLGHHNAELLRDKDLVVVSPGVPASIPLLAAAEVEGIPVWSEIELAWKFVRGPVVAVTGTNGKTTTVSMIEGILTRGGITSRSAGNIGHPLIKAVDEAEEGETLVVEVSSFQLYFIEEFKPRVAVLLNIAEDHFDWHENMREYVEAKRRIWMNQDQDDVLICNLDDTLCVSAVRGAPSRIMFFSLRPDPLATTYASGGRLLSRFRSNQAMPLELTEITAVDRLRLPGEHNLENAMAAATAGLTMGVEPGAAGKALEEYRGLPHRLQLVAEVDGVSFYDDSKATNPHAALMALSAFGGPVAIVLGGRNKGLSFDGLAAELEERRGGGTLRAVYAIGEAGREIRETLNRVSPGIEVRVMPGLEQVFEDLPAVIEAGDAVLFSPACASFDRYEDYRERGDHFHAMVRTYRGDSNAR